MQKFKAGQLMKGNVEQRDRVETAMFLLGRSSIELEECILRTQQALRRSSHVGTVLDPALERLETIRKNVAAARRELSDYWVRRQGERWKTDAELAMQATNEDD